VSFQFRFYEKKNETFKDFFLRFFRGSKKKFAGTKNKNIPDEVAKRRQLAGFLRSRAETN